MKGVVLGLFPADAGKPLALVLVLALALRLLYCFVLGPALVERRGVELGWVTDGTLNVDPYAEIARNVVSGRGYVDGTGRRNYERTPGYVLFLAAVYTLVGDALWKVQAVQALMDTLSCLLVFVLAWRLFNTVAPAVFASLLYALFYKMINMVSRPMTETLIVFLLLGFLISFVDSFSSRRSCLTAGLLLGCMTLTRPVTLLFPIVGIALYAVSLRKRALAHVVPFVIGFLPTVLPVLAVNYHETGRVFYSLGGGRALYMGATIDYSMDLRSEEHRLVREVYRDYGSFAYSPEEDGRLAALALGQIAAEPSSYAAKVLYRGYVFWTFPDYSTPLMALKTATGLAYALVVTSLAILGMRVARRNGVRLAPILSLPVYCYGAYAIVYAHTRYSLPFYPVLFVFASLAVTTWWARCARRAPRGSMEKVRPRESSVHSWTHDQLDTDTFPFAEARSARS